MRRMAASVLVIFTTWVQAEPQFETLTLAPRAQYSHNAYPTVDRLSDGRLICTWAAIDKATGDKAVIVAAFSEDRGRTWSKPMVLIDSKPDLDYDPNILVLGQRILVTSTTVPPTHAQFISTSRTMATRSDDNGKTWTKPYEIPMGHRYTSGKINIGIVLRDGSALLPFSWDSALQGSGKLTSEGEEQYLAAVLISKDRGLTWKTSDDVQTRDPKLPDRKYAISGVDEPAIIELGDGSVFMLCRTGGTRLYESRSKDGGQTWSMPIPSPLTAHNSPASLCPIHGSKPGVLVVWDNSATDRWPLCAAASFDGCKTWSRPRPLTHTDGQETSYPGCIEARDGEFVIVWQHAFEGNVREVESARINLEWLLQEPHASAAGARAEWMVPTAPYRVLVEVPAADIGERKSDAMPAALDVDFTQGPFQALGLPAAVDLDSIQVIRYAPETGKPTTAPTWPFSRSAGERASRFLDKSIPWQFPTSEGHTPEEQVGTFERGAFLVNAKGKGNPGLLTWDHLQEGHAAAKYAVYFDALPSGKQPAVPRQGFLGDGSPRRDPSPGTLTGTLYNRLDVADWDGDGLSDLLIGMGFGYVLCYRNEGDRQHPHYGQGEYLTNALGRILNIGGMSSPRAVDWNGDGTPDLLLGEEMSAGVYWYQNQGTPHQAKLTLRGRVQADGADIVIPAKPCPESPHYPKDYAPSLEVVDWNGDGKLDLLLGGYITGYIWWYENVGTNPNGTPSLKFRGPLESEGKPIDTIWGAHPCVADFDHDGDLDLVSGSFGQAMGGGDQVSEFLIYFDNVGTRRDPRLVRRPFPYEGAAPSDILAQARAVDLNGDGLPDLAVSTMSYIYIGWNKGTPTAPRWKFETQTASWGLAPLSVTQLIDWNRDGLPDLIRSPLDGSGPPDVQINQGQGTQGIFNSPQPLLPKGQEIHHPQPYGDPWAFVYLCDMDRDGDLDILWADGPGNVYLHRNKGTNERAQFDTLGEKLLLTSGAPIKVGPPIVAVDQIKDFTVMQGSRAAVAAADFNGDGLTDLAVGDALGDMFFFANRGTAAQPVFDPGVKLGNLGNRAIPSCYDWDHDGQVDVVGISWSAQMEWYRNLGSAAQPQFAAGKPLTLPPTVTYGPRVVIADWNKDGDDDFLVMSSYPWFCWLDGSYVQHGYAKAQIVTVERRP